jgi:glutaredoxin
MRRWCAVLSMFAIAIAIAFAARPAPAAAETVDVYLFWRVGCPHCERAIEHLDRVAAGDARVRVHRFDVLQGAENRRLLERIAETLGTEANAVPFTVIGDVVWIGYLDDATTGSEMKRRIEACLRGGCPDSVQALRDGLGGAEQAPRPATEARRLPAAVSLPLFGEVALHELSLPTLTVVLAALDGFNPCAMWALVFLLGLLVGMQDRLRMWVLGTAFVAASAAVYLLFMAAWLNLLLFIGMIVWVRIGIGLVALAGAAYQLRTYVLARDEACPVTAPEARRQVFARLRALSGRREFYVALAGIVALAFAVNLVELLCSAGIPVVYTQILTMSALPVWQYYAYLLLYIVVFMLDDLAVLVLGLATLHVSGLTTKYARHSRLVGGILLAGIGAVLILRPEWLAFA